MKKILALLLIFSMIMIPSVFADEYTGYKEIKIGLFFGSTALESVELKSEGGFNICFGEDKNFTYHYSMLEEEITVTKAGDTDFSLGANFYSAPSGQVSIRPARGKIWVNDKEYRGFIFLKRESGGNITVINVIDVESYLYSVVGKEMSPSWNIEALKAQAVCARTYAMKNLGKYKNYGFDLCTTQASQVYDGVIAEYPSTIRAVRETAFQVVRYEGKPCEVFYFSSSGGMTSSVEHVWSTPLPYLRAVEDPYENPEEASKSTWSETFTKEQMRDILISKDVNIGEVLDVKVTEYAPSGRAIALTFYGTEGEWTSVRDKARTTLSLSSQNYVIVPNEDGTYTFDGKGWGHGVGMSQWGAKGMADNGFTYDEIIKWYFTDVEVS